MPGKKQPMAKSTLVRVGAAQMIIDPKDIPGNVDKALAYCDRAARKNVRILCFPECADAGLEWHKESMKKPDLLAKIRAAAEPVPGSMVKRFAQKARDTGMYIIMGTVERPLRSDKLYNTAFVVGPTEGYMGKYRKIFAGGALTAGRRAPVFDTPYGRIGIFICHDLRYPEIARLLVFKGAQILFNPSNYFKPNWDARTARSINIGRQNCQRVRAMDNGVPFILANAGRHEYINDTRILAPAKNGPENVLAKAKRREQLVVADVEVPPHARNKAKQQLRVGRWLFRELADTMKNLA